MILQKISWALWIPGTILVMLSWAHAVTPKVGWIGFWIALGGTILSFARPRSRTLRPATPGPSSRALDDLSKLADLRERGAISEEEFQSKRRAILDQIGGPPAPKA